MKTKRTSIARKSSRVVRLVGGVIHRAFMALSERTRQAILFCTGFLLSGLGFAVLGYFVVYRAFEAGLTAYLEGHRVLVGTQVVCSALLVVMGFMLMVVASPGIEDDEAFRD